MDKTYQEAADDVYADAITELGIIYDELSSESNEEEKYKDGLGVAIDYLKDKRGELYG